MLLEATPLEDKRELYHYLTQLSELNPTPSLDEEKIADIQKAVAEKSDATQVDHCIGLTLCGLLPTAGATMSLTLLGLGLIPPLAYLTVGASSAILSCGLTFTIFQAKALCVTQKTISEMAEELSANIRQASQAARSILTYLENFNSLTGELNESAGSSSASVPFLSAPDLPQECFEGILTLIRRLPLGKIRTSTDQEDQANKNHERFLNYQSSLVTLANKIAENHDIRDAQDLIAEAIRKSKTQDYYLPKIPQQTLSEAAQSGSASTYGSRNFAAGLDTEEVGPGNRL